MWIVDKLKWMEEKADAGLHGWVVTNPRTKQTHVYLKYGDANRMVSLWHKEAIRAAKAKIAACPHAHVVDMSSGGIAMTGEASDSTIQASRCLDCEGVNYD